MAEILREQALWRKGRTPIVAKFNDEHVKLLSEIAGRGFRLLPGYAYDHSNALEIMTKMQLSELNTKILSETIERELKQYGLDYNLAYKNAVITWEIDKQALLLAWDSEYANIKLGMAQREGVLDRLAIEVGKRAETLIEAKAAIEIQVEAYKTTLASLDGSTAVYEVQLAQAKLLTAQRKLTIIPILQAILAKEQQLLVAEGNKATAFSALMEAERQVALKKATLTPFINELASFTELYADKVISVQIPQEGLIAAEKLAQATSAQAVSASRVLELDAEVTNEGTIILVNAGRRAYQIAQWTAEQLITTTDALWTNTLVAREAAATSTLVSADNNASYSAISSRLTAHQIGNAIRGSSESTIGVAERSAEEQMANSDTDRMNQVATIQAAAAITASLEHLIG